MLYTYVYAKILSYIDLQKQEVDSTNAYSRQLCWETSGSQFHLGDRHVNKTTNAAPQLPEGIQAQGGKGHLKKMELEKEQLKQKGVEVTAWMNKRPFTQVLPS